MSGDAKKEDKGGEKKSLPAKLIAASLGILAVLVFFAVSNVTIPETVNQGAQLTTNTGGALHNLARGTDRLGSGASDWVGSVLRIVIGGLVLFLLGREAAKMIKGGGSHDDHAHPPADKKPADKKPEEKH
jgi:hypothetical protein